MASRFFVMVRSVVVSAVFISLWTWFAPRWMAASKRVALEVDGSGAPLYLAVPLMIAGAAIMVRCIFDFAWTGLGTPAPFDAPRRFVAVGLYRWVRNPMYVGMGLFLTGEALVLPAVRRQMLEMTAVLWAIVTLFVILYEEPTLYRLYGEEYDRYRQQVRRWLPRPPAHSTRAS